MTDPRTQPDLRSEPVSSDVDQVGLLLAMSSEPLTGEEDDLDRALALATDFFGLAFGIVSRVEGDSYEIRHVHQPDGAGIEVGQKFELGNTYCAITLEAQDVVSIDEMKSSHYSGHPCYGCFGLESYLGVPLFVEGEVYGTLNFSAAEPRSRPWTETERQLVRLLARWVESSIAQRRLRDRLAGALEDLDHANRELEHRNADLDHFVQMASHDLQAPLLKLVAFSELLETDLGDDLPEQAAQDLEFIQAESKQMQALVHDLLEFCRTGVARIDEEAVDLDDCVDAALYALQAIVDETGAEIVRAPLPPVRGQATLLTQVFQNLICNAMKFQPPGTTPRVDIAGDLDGDAVSITVSDNGIGIDPKHAEKVFSPFQRLHGGEYEGTGLGLAICRKILVRQGGDIRVEPGTDGGSVFTLSLEPDA